MEIHKTSKKYLGLSDAERSEIQILLGEGYSHRKIAVALGRSPNTISREIRVNSVTSEKTGVLEYSAKKAKPKSRLRRRSRRYQWQKIEHDPKLWLFVIKHLKLHWNPDEISKYLKLHPELGMYVSMRQIYEWLRSSRGQAYCEYLYSGRYRPKKHRINKTARVMIPDRVSITERPLAAQDRAESGHMEYDSVVSGKEYGRPKSTFALAVLTERATRLVSARIVPNLRPEGFAQCIALQASNMHGIKSFTTDNGIENKQHRLITEHVAGNPNVYFTDPYSSWQKGGVENANKMLRRYFPKGTNFANITQLQVDQAVALINQKPRKILGYKSAIQCAVEKGLFRQGVLLVTKF
jgi:transposase, IS30 family